MKPQRRALILVASGSLAMSAGCVPGYEVTGGGDVASFTGRIVVGRAEFNGDTFDCDWLIGADGRRLAVIYPPGWDQRYDPFQLLDASGRMFAEEGDVLRITYVTGGIGESVCPGEVQAAQTVERVDALSVRDLSSAPGG